MEKQVSIRNSKPLTDVQRDLRRAANILRSAGCSEVYVFGSAATGSVDSRSDIDLAVRGCPTGQFFELLARLFMALDRPVDLVDLDQHGAFARHLESEGNLVRIG